METEPDAVGFTGTQRGLAVPQKDALVSALIGFREAGVLWMRNGDCIGADEYAGKVWRSLGGYIHLHPPEITKKRAFLRYEEISPEKSYLIRNRDIVNDSGVMVATPAEVTEQARGGTWSTIRYARLRQRPLMVIWPNGHWLKENWPPLTNGA